MKSQIISQTARAAAGSLRRLVRWSTAWAWQKEIGTCEGLARRCSTYATIELKLATQFAAPVPQTEKPEAA